MIAYRKQPLFIGGLLEADAKLAAGIERRFECLQALEKIDVFAGFVGVC
jgi:hypothetical protein